METKLNPFKNRLLGKLVFILILVLLLLIPMSWVQSLIQERQYMQAEVQARIASSWGEQQTVSGPVLAVPVERTVLHEDKPRVVRETRFFAPEALNMQTALATETRYLGIFSTVVYTATNTLEGSFQLDLASLPDQERLLWEEAVLILGMSESSTISGLVKASWNGEAHRASPGTRYPEVLGNGVHISLDIDQPEKVQQFSINWTFRGSESMNFVPSGRQSRIQVQADWPSPSFQGKNLPAERTIREDGFDAEWVASEYNRPYPSTWKIGELSMNQYSDSFGVQLLQRADHYQKNMRSAKYALLIIALSFAVFFFFELWLKTGIHPIQYIMIGFSLVVFYTLLLSLTEHIGFDRAYWSSFVAILLLLQVYTYGMLSSWKPVLLLSGLFVALYGYIFVLLQLEDFALLAGSVGLFVMLATVMLLSRKVDWYRLGD